MAKKLVLTEDVKHLIVHNLPDALVSPTGNRLLTLLQDIVDQLNEANGFTTTTTVTPTTTVAP